MTCKDCTRYDLCYSRASVFLDCYGTKFSYAENVQKLCDHFVDRSQFIKLPCRIGDTAYIIHKYKKGGGFIQEVTVSGIHLRDTIGYRNIPRAEYLVVRSYVNLSARINLKEIGKTVFFTKEEAQKKYMNCHTKNKKTAESGNSQTV